MSKSAANKTHPERQAEEIPPDILVGFEKFDLG